MKLLFFLFLFLSLSVSAQDCEKYTTGVFEVDNMDGTVSTIVRKKKYQTEECGDIKVKDKIVWLSDCSYKLIPIKTDKALGDLGNMELIYTIVQTFDHSYIVKITGVEDMVIRAHVFEKGHLPE